MELFNINNNENHPWNNEYIIEKSKILILGTFPPRRFTVQDRLSRTNFTNEELEKFSEDVNFYYGSKDSKFWTFIEIIFNNVLNENVYFLYNFNNESILQRINFAQNYKLSFTDIIQQTQRSQDTANDQDLINYTLNDILKDISKTDISSILLTSFSDQINVKTLFTQYLFDNYKIVLNWNYIKTNNIGNYYETIFVYNNKNYLVRTIYSPSRCEYTGVPLRKIIKQYKTFIIDYLLQNAPEIFN